MTALSWFTAGRAVLHQTCRSSAIIAAGAGCAAVWLVSHGGGYIHARPVALVTPAAVHNPAAHAAANVLGLAVPMASLIGTFVGQQTLLQHRRALMAAFPDPTWARSAHWLIIMIGLAGVTTMVGSAVPSAAGFLIAPDRLLLWLLPAAVAVSGLQAFTGELSRQPLAGLVAGALWMVVSFGVENLLSLRTSHPVAVFMLTPATTYPLGRALQAVNFLTGGLGLLLWAAAAATAYYFRRQGWDV